MFDDENVALAERALDRLGTTEPRLQAQVHRMLAGHYLRAAKGDEAETHVQAAVVIASESDDPVMLAELRVDIGVRLLGRLEHTEARKVLDEAVELAATANHPGAGGLAFLQLLRTILQIGDIPAFRQCLIRFSEFIKAHGGASSDVDVHALAPAMLA